MKTNKFIVLALALSLPACSVLAQNDGPPPGGPGPGGQNDGPPGGGPGPGRRPPPMPLIRVLDANHDGIISSDEIANAVAALKTLDKNGDGQLTRDEYLPVRGQGGPGGGPGGPDGQGAPPRRNNQDQNGAAQGRPQRPVPLIVAALDADGDGIISAVELANAPAALLKLDKNGDGKLTMEELMGPRPQRPGGPGGPDGQGGPDNGQRPPPPEDGGPDGQFPPPDQNN